MASASAPAPAPASAGAPPTADSLPGAREAPQSFKRRDKLVAIEHAVQARWAAAREFETDAPSAAAAAEEAARPKYMCTFPYPYMNGRLHLGHAFTVSKAEFAAGYKRLRGFSVLFPFAFHCTGMPIQAAANRLKREIETGAHTRVLAQIAAGGSAAAAPPPEQAAAPEPEVAAPPAAPAAVAAAVAPAAAAAAPADDKVKELGKFVGKKTKAVAKGAAGATVTQYEILLRSGIAAEEVPRFQDPRHWLAYFPPLGEADLRGFGAHIDWRRSFVTTDANPFYDSFIRWQFGVLRRKDKVGFGKRPTVFSPIDGQACADHDRASGEGVTPQEYTLVKMRLVEVPAAHPHAATTLAPLAALIAAGRSVFFVAATLRPETMYGQTNCFLLPEGEYGAFDVGVGGAAPGGDVYLCSERSARNMSYQGLAPARGAPLQLGEPLLGEHLLGLPLAAPYAAYERVYTLPLMTISMGKGTGVVTSVPSDAPDDWAALRDLREKPKLREKFGLTEAMVAPEIVEIIDIPGFGRRAAVTICETLGIKSQNEAAKLKEAKEAVYMAGFYQGTLLVGKYAGRKVCDAKPLVRADMIAEGLAGAYFEPESLVMSRSGDECVVAELDQWFLRYGEAGWRGETEAWVKGGGFKAFSPPAQQAFEHTLGWLQEWACSRSFGLGTRLPWDEQFVIESLSDSTIYMAYYTVAHLLHGGSLDGAAMAGPRGAGPLGVRADMLSEGLWDFVFLCDSPAEAEAAAARALAAAPDLTRAQLDALRREFRYWYPLDLRVSGRDLIQNHLTMSLYNHAAVWGGGRADRMPQAFFCNGHVLVDGEKMSKSKGNFLMLHEAVARWSADATRFALADAGDSLEDANFERDRADNAILRLTTEEDYAAEALALAAAGKLRGGAEGTGAGALTAAALAALEADPALTYADRVFLSKISWCVREAEAAYEGMRFREALKYGFFELLLARDAYRDFCEKVGAPAHAGVVRRFCDVLCVLIAPICPHWAEHVWGGVLGRAGSVTRAAWPLRGAEDETLLRADAYLAAKLHEFRLAIIKATTVKASKQARGIVAQPKPTHATVFVASAWPPWQRKPLALLSGLWDPVAHAATGGFPADALKQVQALCAADAELKPFLKRVMPLASTTMQDMAGRSERTATLAMRMPFDEFAVWRDNAEYVRCALDLSGGVRVLRADDAAAPLAPADDPQGKAKDVFPGSPDVHAWAE